MLECETFLEKTPDFKVNFAANQDGVYETVIKIQMIENVAEELFKNRI